MKRDYANQGRLISRGYRILCVFVAALTFLLLVMGGIVCITDSSRGCPDWPACYGRLVPPPRLDSIIEYIHRVMAALTSLSIIVSAAIGWRLYRSDPWVIRPPAIALPFLLVVVVLGAMVVLRGLEPALAALDLGSALVVLALMLVPPAVAVSRRTNRTRFSLRGGYAGLAGITLTAIFVVLVSAALVSDSGSADRCLGWPLPGPRVLLGDLRGWFQLTRLVVGGVTALLIVTLVVQTWRTQRSRPALVAIGTLLGGALFAEVLIGALTAVAGAGLLLLGLNAFLAITLWSLVVIVTVLATLSPVPAS